ncbi:MAG: BlaI/MecI/CopY family transcriptional regulator [Clostridium sp.]|nr:BlaI/MecI/CopY family transcriptional regulator [Clostridium sp.]
MFIIGEFKKLTNEEMNLMKIMWELKREVTPSELLLIIEETRGKKWAKQTIGTILGRMVDKGVITCSKRGRNNYYIPTVTVKEYEQLEAREVLSNMYKGSIKNFLSALYYDKKKMSKKDIEELKEWFSDK